MKTIIIILLFFASSLNAQFLRTSGNNLGIYNSGVNSSSFGSAFDSGLNLPNETFTIRAKQFFDRVMALGKTLTTAQQRWYNDSIFVPLLDSGLIGQTRSGDSLQALWAFVRFAGDTTILKMNLFSDSNTVTNVSAGITWTDSGVVGNGSSAYLNLNYNPVWDSSIYKALSGGLFIYSKTDYSGGVDMGSQEGSSPRYYSVIQIRSGSTLMSGINSTEPLPTSTNADSRGAYSVSRSEYGYIKNYKNGAMLVTGGSIHFSVKTSLNLVLCAFNVAGTISQYTTRCYPFAAVTSGLSNDKTRKLHNILNNSLKGRGYNVY